MAYASPSPRPVQRPEELISKSLTALRMALSWVLHGVISKPTHHGVLQHVKRQQRHRHRAGQVAHKQLPVANAQEQGPGRMSADRVRRRPHIAG